MLLQESRLMEHYGYGDILIMEDWDLIKEEQQDIHHQFKYLVLHGLKWGVVMRMQWEQLKLMEHYGHGEDRKRDI